MTPDDLVEIELIKRLKYRYLRCLDQKLWDEIEGCFTPDATASYSGGAYVCEGRPAIIEFLHRTMGATTMLSSHRCHHPEIDLVGDDEATGTWALEDVVVLTDLDVNVQGAGFYSDRYRRLDGEWRIERTGYLRSYEELLPRASVKGLKVTGDWWATAGRSTLA